LRSAISTGKDARGIYEAAKLRNSKEALELGIQMGKKERERERECVGHLWIASDS